MTIAGALPRAFETRRPRAVSGLTIVSWLAIPVFLLIWEIIARTGIFNEALFPAPSSVIVALAQMLWSGELAIDVAASMQRLVVGYAAGALAGLVIGTATGRFAVPRSCLSPIIQMLRPVPPISFVSVAVLWFGLGEMSKYFLIFWGVFFVVWMTTHYAVLRIDQVYINAARSLGASSRVVLAEIVLPGAIPQIIVGLRTALPIAFYSLVAAEIAGADHGVAYMMEIAHTNFQVDKVFGGLVAMGVLSFVVDRSFVFVMRLMFPWAYQG